MATVVRQRRSGAALATLSVAVLLSPAGAAAPQGPDRAMVEARKHKSDPNDAQSHRARAQVRPLASTGIGCHGLGIVVSTIVVIATVAPFHQPRAQELAARFYAELPGVRLSYLDSGAGTSIVLLHAATGSSRVWEHQIPAYTAAGYRVIAYDRRGHGETSIQSAATSSHVSADDLDALMAHLRVDRFHLVGTAAGGIVAMDYALSFPGRLRSLVIANSIVGVRDEEYLAMGRRLRPSPQFEQLPPDFRELGPAYRASNPEGTKRWIDLERGSRSGTARSEVTSRNTMTFALLETLTVPTLLLTGDADLYTPPPVLELFAKRIRTAEALVIDGAGHSAYWEQPEQFNRAVLEFVRKH